MECIPGIDRPQPGFRPSAGIQDTGKRLARLAKEMGVPFEFHAIAEKWEAITPAHLFLREDEVLAVNCVFRLRHLLDESVTAASPRNLVLSRIKSLNPKVSLFFLPLACSESTIHRVAQGSQFVLPRAYLHLSESVYCIFLLESSLDFFLVIALANFRCPLESGFLLDVDCVRNFLTAYGESSSWVIGSL